MMKSSDLYIRPKTNAFGLIKFKRSVSLTKNVIEQIFSQKQPSFQLF